MQIRPLSLLLTKEISYYCRLKNLESLTIINPTTGVQAKKAGIEALTEGTCSRSSFLDTPLTRWFYRIRERLGSDTSFDCRYDHSHGREAGNDHLRCGCARGRDYSVPTLWIVRLFHSLGNSADSVRASTDQHKAERKNGAEPTRSHPLTPPEPVNLPLRLRRHSLSTRRRYRSLRCCATDVS